MCWVSPGHPESAVLCPRVGCAPVCSSLPWQHCPGARMDRVLVHSGCKSSTLLCPGVKHTLGCSRSHLQHCPGAQDGAGTGWVTKSEVSCGLVWGVFWAALGQTGSSLGALGGARVHLACTHSGVLECGMLCPSFWARRHGVGVLSGKHSLQISGSLW